MQGAFTLYSSDELTHRMSIFFNKIGRISSLMRMQGDEKNQTQIPDPTSKFCIPIKATDPCSEQLTVFPTSKDCQLTIR